MNARLTETNWYDSSPDFGRKIKAWKESYNYVLDAAIPWKPDEDLLKKTFTDASNEAGVSETDDRATSLLQEANGLLYSKDSAYFPTESGSASSKLESEVDKMFATTDQEQADLFVDDWQQLKYPPKLSTFHWPLSSRLPNTTSPVLPVGVSVTPIWEIPAVETPAKPTSTNEEKIVLDKLLLTVQAASSVTTTSPPPATGTSSSDLTDFQPKQNVTVNISTVLNSPSVLDRIEYISTYIYIFPWQNTPNGNVVLEREFWRNYFEINSLRDDLLKHKMEASDMRRAIEEMRVQVNDIGTLVKYNPVNLGSLAQTTSDETDLGLSGNLPNISPPINATLKYAGILNTVANIQLNQQLDQRSTFIDPQGDFVRITQRGMQSVNQAGRFKETVTLNVPAAYDSYRVVEPLNPDPKTSKDTNELEVTTISQPLYSRVEGITFSVVVARQATHLLHSSRDRYGLEDARDATFIADVTPPKLITFWQWERSIDNIRTWDIFGKTSVPARNVYFTTFEGERPSPLNLIGFSPLQLEKFLDELKSQKGMKATIGKLAIGLVENESNPTKLVELTDN